LTTGNYTTVLPIFKKVEAGLGDFIHEENIDFLVQN
jgi:hypothetical protein